MSRSRKPGTTSNHVHCTTSLECNDRKVCMYLWSDKVEASQSLKESHIWALGKFRTTGILMQQSIISGDRPAAIVTYAFVRCIDNRPMPTSVGILLDPDCKRRPKTTDRGSAIKKVAKISFFIRQWAEDRLLNGHCPKSVSGKKKVSRNRPSQ